MHIIDDAAISPKYSKWLKMLGEDDRREQNRTQQKDFLSL